VSNDVLGQIASAARTHPGRVRTRNEDAVLNRGEIGLWAVADGMGGHSRGDWASAQVVHHLSQVPSPSSASQFLNDVRAAIHAAHDEIRAAVEGGASEGVIGCTVVAVMMFGHHFACLWAGDSRLYRLRGGRLQQLSRDHSRVQEMIDANLLSPAEAHAHPHANIITRAVGVGDLELDLLTEQLDVGDAMLLCTDGLDKMVSDDDIAECLAGRPPEEAANALIERALERGGRDNVTVVVISYSENGGEEDDTIRTVMAPPPGGGQP
jgi:serine/threonine protein phosphatase PrpC